MKSIIIFTSLFFSFFFFSFTAQAQDIVRLEAQDSVIVEGLQPSQIEWRERHSAAKFIMIETEFSVSEAVPMRVRQMYVAQLIASYKPATQGNKITYTQLRPLRYNGKEYYPQIKAVIYVPKSA